MSGTPVNTAFPIITDPATGIGLNAGKVYIGVAGQDPEVYPVQVWWDANQSQPAVQPLRTLGGYIVNNGTPATAYVAVDYSMRVRDRFDSLISYSQLAGRAGDLFASLTVAGLLEAGSIDVDADLAVGDDVTVGGDLTVQTPNAGTRCALPALRRILAAQPFTIMNHSPARYINRQHVKGPDQIKRRASIHRANLGHAGPFSKPARPAVMQRNLRH